MCPKHGRNGPSLKKTINARKLQTKLTEAAICKAITSFLTVIARSLAATQLQAVEPPEVSNACRDFGLAALLAVPFARGGGTTGTERSHEVHSQLSLGG